MWVEKSFERKHREKVNPLGHFIAFLAIFIFLLVVGKLGYSKNLVTFNYVSWNTWFTRIPFLALTAFILTIPSYISQLLTGRSFADQGRKKTFVCLACQQTQIPEPRCPNEKGHRVLELNAVEWREGS